VKLARYALDFWGPIYVNESLGTSALTSAITSTLMPIGGILGAIIAGYLSDRVFQNRRAPVIIISLLATSAVLALGQLQIQNVWLMGAFFFSIGLFLYGPDTLISATAAIDFGTKRGAGAATGLVNGVGSIGAILGGYLPGVLTSATDWTVFFRISLIGLVVSAVIMIPLWKHRPPTA
jgi:OPA family sugar phosphate sensor protein UhpC-like MFS transporter